MSMRLFVCLVFIMKIVASDYQSTSQYESASKYSFYNQRNTRKLITESFNDSPSETAQSMNTTENKTNSTDSIVTVVSIKKEDEKNETATKKPDANKEGMDTHSSQIVNSYSPNATYEVTENVIDIPDDRTSAGPIVTTFTHRPPTLNLAKPTNKTDRPPILNPAKPTNKTDTDKTTKSGIKTKKNRLSILHINAEFDDKVHEVHENKVLGLLKGIKKYIRSFRRDIVDSFHSFLHKHQDVHEYGERFERAVYNEDNSRKRNGVQNMDKTVLNLHQRHISMT